MMNSGFSLFPYKKKFKIPNSSSSKEIQEQNTRSAAVKSLVHLLSAQKGSRNSLQSWGLAKTMQFTLKEESQDRLNEWWQQQVML